MLDRNKAQKVFDDFKSGSFLFTILMIKNWTWA